MRTLRIRLLIVMVLLATLGSLSGFSARAQEDPTPAITDDETQEESDRDEVAALTEGYEPVQTVRSVLAAGRPSGEYDYPTALLYRAYSITRDPRLPLPLQSLPSDDHDESLFTEIAQNVANMPDNVRTELETFLQRPSEPASAFFAPRENPQPIATGSDIECDNDWATLPSEENEGQFRVWARCTGGYEDALRDSVEMIDDFWTPMVEFMGPPVPDSGSLNAGGDEAIDIYLVEGREKVDRAGREYDLDERNVLAVAIQTPPFRDNTASGYIIANRTPENLGELKSTLAHEFFHVLQYAHNATIGFRTTGEEDADGYPIYEENWLMEATAMWAETQWSPESAAQFIYPWFALGFQGTEAPLHLNYTPGTEDSFRMYAGFIWFTYMEQELGAESIAELWDAAEDVDAQDFEGTVALIDEMLPFEEHYKEFMLRNLNQDLSPGDPISPTYADDFEWLRAGAKPVLQNEAEDWALLPSEEDENQVDVRASLTSLTARYYYWFQPNPEDVEQVTLDLTDMAPADTLDARMVVKIDGTWELRDLEPSDPIVFCDENIEAFFLILGNHDLDLESEITGLFSLTASETASC